MKFNHKTLNAISALRRFARVVLSQAQPSKSKSLFVSALAALFCVVAVGGATAADGNNRTVTYKVVFGKDTVKTVTVTATIGSVAQVPDNLKVGDFASFDYSPANIDSTTHEVVATMAWSQNAPIQFSNDGEQTHYYSLHITNANTTAYFNYDQEQTPNIKCASAANGDNGQWAFYGNPYSVIVKNKAAGNDMQLASQRTNNNPANDGREVKAVLTHDFKTYPDSVWRIYPATQAMNGTRVTGDGFYLENTDGHRLNIRNQGGNSTYYLAYWTKGYDQGSAFLPVQIAVKPDVASPTLKDGVYRISTGTGANTRWASVKTVGNTKSLYAETEKPDTTTWHGLFLIRKTGDNTYSIQDLESGLYLNKQSQTMTAVPTGNSAYNFTLKVDGDVDSTNGYWWNIYNDAADNADRTAAWEADPSGAVYVWRVPTGKTAGASDWKIEQDTTYTTEKISNRLSYFTGITNPQAGGVYRIVSAYYSGRAIYDNYMGGNEVTTNSEDADNLYQLWHVKQAANDRIILQNVITGKYMHAVSTSSYYQMRDSAQATPFKLQSGKSDAYTTYYFLKEWGNNNEMHCASSQGYNIVTWHSNADASRWYFKRATVDSAAVAKERANYLTRTDMRDNVAKYSQLISKYFSDNACTKLKDEYKNLSDEAIKADMAKDSLPQTLQDIVLKIKDNKWETYNSGRNWEQFFRIADYIPYTDTDGYKWSSQMGIGYLWGNQTGPSGIATNDGESYLYIFVDSIPAGSSIRAELIGLQSGQGSLTTLHKGLNTILTNGQNNVNIRYWADTSNGGKYDNNGKLLSDFPNVKIHIEGGFVNGMFDLARNMTDSMYNDMYNDGLITKAQAFDSKGFNCAQHWRSQDVRNFKQPGKDGSMVGVVKCFDDLIKSENELEGFVNDDYAKGRFNGLLQMIACSYNYMFATTGGCYVNWNNGNMRTFLHFDNPNQRGDSFWGVAHEFGHNHQNFINLPSSTEESNNLFTLVAQFELTPFTSRYAPDATVANEANFLNNERNWWNQSTGQFPEMLFKLYLFYHAAGNDTCFYPKVFHLLRSKYNIQHQGTNINGRNGYLNLAVACCEAAGENLEDFFRVFGMFNFTGNQTLNDYYSANVVVTQEDIDWALSEMRKYPKKGGAANALFACDDISTTPAIYPGNHGENRSYYPGGNFGRNGNEMGNWDSFKPTVAGYGTAKITNTTTDSNGNVTITTSTTGKVGGYKVYDFNGKLIWIANTRTFTIPKSVIDKAGSMDSVFICVSTTKGTEDAVGHVNVSIDSTGYATLYYGDRHLMVPQGVSAYTYKTTDNRLVVDHAYEAGDTIPSKTGVVLKARTGRYAFELADTFKVKSDENLLLGSDTLALTVNKANADDGFFYMLAHAADSDSVGFYYANENGAQFYNPGHEAYLVLQNKGADYYLFKLLDSGTATGIGRMLRSDDSDANAPIYNLQGIRIIGKPVKPGIYVQNGKKFVVK